jgi:ribosomal protein L37AE/L43A
MKIKYDKPIIQYDLKGNKIAHYDDRHEANKHTDIHVDSIISCCLGKYKTAGGFVFRFENDEFVIKNNTKSNHECKICGSNETIRSMAMHLRFAHKMKTDEYVEKYGEFRPKQLKQITKQQTSGIKCMICGTKLNSNQHLMYHITKDHPDITQHEYIIKFIYKGDAPLCKCGCGEEVNILRNGNNCDLNKETYSRDYIKGHWDWEVFVGVGKQSKEELEILNYIKSIYKGPIIESSRNIIENNEIDIYLPELNIGIEYNGLYWHSEKNNVGRTYHINKTNKCANKNIRLIQIFADEWYNKKDIVKNKIKHILKLNNNTKIYARKCIIKPVSTQDKNEFLEKHHIQGKDRSRIKIGLYYNDELVALTTFSPPRIALGAKHNNKNEWELSRYVSSCNVVGGLSKLIKYFIKTNSPTLLYSYSDNRWTDPNNNVYLTIGFTKIKSSSPGYWYTKDFTSRIHRYNLRKQKLKQMGLDISNKKEHEIARDIGYYRIWDCGTTRYELKP